MGKTLFDLTYETARALGILDEGVATNGSTTTLVDTVERTETDDFWNGGSAWVIYDAGGAGAAPQGEYSVITDFVQSTSTATLRSTLTAAIAVGDRYAVGRAKYSLNLLIQKVNEVLSSMVIEKADITTITTANSQTEHSLPSDLLELQQVWLQTNDDSNDNRWERIYDFHIQKSATGTANKIVFGRQFDSGYEAKIVYTCYHAALRASTDKLDDSINASLVVYNAVVACLLTRMGKGGEVDPDLNNLVNFFQAKAKAVSDEHPQEIPKKTARTIHPLFDRP
jgi:hypothetical protein